jgi:hypothetical protein
MHKQECSKTCFIITLLLYSTSFCPWFCPRGIHQWWIVFILPLYSFMWYNLWEIRCIFYVLKLNLALIYEYKQLISLFWTMLRANVPKCTKHFACKNYLIQMIYTINPFYSSLGGTERLGWNPARNHPVPSDNEWEL